MELDKRIKEGKRPLTCFDLKEASGFLEKTGYFTNELDYFSDLSEIGDFSGVQFGRLLKINNNKRCVFKYLSMDGSYENSYRFFLPEDWVLPKEKKYRPYTIKEFEEIFLKNELDGFITFREKDEPNNVYTLRYNGNFISDNIEYVCLGAKNIACASLFRYYEVANNDGEFVPFGVEVWE